MSGGERKVPLAHIVLDSSIQQRVRLDKAIVQEYKDLMQSGTVFPPLDVFFDGQRYWLADGFHRLEAYRQLRAEHPRTWPNRIRCRVHSGDRHEALWFACSANATHGLRRTNNDKHKAVLTALQHPKGRHLSNRAIARHCGVSEFLVRQCRKALFPEDDNTTRVVHRVVHRKRQVYEMKTAHIGRAKAKTVPLIRQQPDETSVSAPASPTPENSSVPLFFSQDEQDGPFDAERVKKVRDFFLAYYETTPLQLLYLIVLLTQHFDRQQMTPILLTQTPPLLYEQMEQALEKTAAHLHDLALAYRQARFASSSHRSHA